MAVHLTRIYTRTGDAGTTALGDMSRVAKSDARVGAYADCDETNAVIGMAIASGGVGERTAAVLGVIQNDLFDVGADLCTPIVATPKYEPLRVTEDQVTQLESWCDDFNEDLPKLSSFILPGGTVAAAHLHHARTVARRAERSAWLLAETAPVNDCALRYLNRLSDLLFILARVENPNGDVLWRPGGDRGVAATDRSTD
ncbi:cob(I)yrinic acid a,c-diamide adenosyltransferase [Mycolicibacterium sp. 050158]|jgi:cob(I)alamin adenosyltransferase|uniref:cob(I)yrinic acid a,c-diamide adenosyltransferase n=1 Tax=Mycolicibacterium sp. 050158 TaxID=3090602 RepID=UPI00299EE837|nr:cob(I)yrinic acid a,c-diamide adenosyltransferase [Mycolicibacterium sp. 050158]MDX1888081.1 cob(I)yrinic acid a,c-diamide adenosyltransferase [Mycolicibacterium sp. 050158]